jgi:hypothetical protein
MSHGAQEKKLRDVRKIPEIVISRKTFQGEDEELNERNFTASSAAGGVRTRTPLLHTRAH